MLLGLTLATGVIDAVSIVGLGRVFVANMTGNIAFIGFALAGAPGFSLIASLIALVAFLGGAGLGGTVISTLHRRTILLSASTAIQLVLMSAAAMHGSFTILEFDDDDEPSVTYVESGAGARLLNKPAPFARYRDIFRKLIEKSIPLKEYVP